MELPAEIQGLAQQLGERLGQTRVVQAYLAADQAFRADTTARSLNEQLLALQESLIERQMTGELIAQVEVEEFYALREQFSCLPTVEQRQEALAALRAYFMKISTVLSYELGIDYAAMAGDHHRYHS